jgi:hypothetical protein
MFVPQGVDYELCCSSMQADNHFFVREELSSATEFQISRAAGFAFLDLGISLKD